MMQTFSKGRSKKNHDPPPLVGTKKGQGNKVIQVSSSKKLKRYGFVPIVHLGDAPLPLSPVLVRRFPLTVA